MTFLKKIKGSSLSSDKGSNCMQPITAGYYSMISPTVTAKSRTFGCLSSEPICCHIKDIQLKYPVSYIIKFSKIHKILSKNG